MKKPGNLFTPCKQCGKHLRKSDTLCKHAALLKMSSAVDVYRAFRCYKSTTWFFNLWNIDHK